MKVTVTRLETRPDGRLVVTGLVGLVTFEVYKDLDGSGGGSYKPGLTDRHDAALQRYLNTVPEWNPTPVRRAAPVWAVTPCVVGQDYDEAFEGYRN